MGLADAAIRGIVDSVAFRASASPYLLLDTQLRIRAANLAYQRATLHTAADLVGEWMFDVFPDNPATPEARAVERLGRSSERALATGAPDRMDLQRYDVPAGPEGFVEKTWLPRNMPVRDAEGRPAGLLHHVEDVTHLLVTTALERDLVRPDEPSGAPPVVGSAPQVEALVRDSAERRARAHALIGDSRQAVERMTHRMIGAGDGPRATDDG